MSCEVHGRRVAIGCFPWEALVARVHACVLVAVALFEAKSHPNKRLRRQEYLQVRPIGCQTSVSVR